MEFDGTTSRDDVEREREREIHNTNTQHTMNFVVCRLVGGRGGTIAVVGQLKKCRSRFVSLRYVTLRLRPNYRPRVVLVGRALIQNILYIVSKPYTIVSSSSLLRRGVCRPHQSINQPISSILFSDVHETVRSITNYNIIWCLMSLSIYLSISLSIYIHIINMTMIVVTRHQSPSTYIIKHNKHLRLSQNPHARTHTRTHTHTRADAVCVSSSLPSFVLSLSFVLPFFSFVLFYYLFS